MRVSSPRFQFWTLAGVLALVGASGVLISLGPPPARAEQAEAAGVVLGRVVNASGAAFRGATVDLLQAGAVAQTTRTNARGEFRFASVPPGMYDVRASRKGLVPALVRLVVGDLPTPRLLLSLGIPAPYALEGEAYQGSGGLGTIPGGVAGGVPGGVVGGVVGGLPAPPPAAQPIAPQPSAPALARVARPHPSMPPKFHTEAYDRIDDSGFRRVGDDPLSTFSIDVDTASYTNVRRYLDQGTLPPPDAVRIEELINYFRFSYPDARGDAPFSVTTEVAACSWNPKHKLALVGLQARRGAQQKAARNFVFLLDVSGSMTPPDKLPLVQTAMRMLVDTLTANDRVAIVVYAGASGLVLPSTPGNRKAEIDRAIAELHAGGSTNGAAGIQLAYDTAASGFVTGGVNRVILATDGDFNVGVTSQGELVRLIERERERGIFLSVLGVGTDNLKDSTMEKLADKGNGNYAYLDSLHEARRVLIEQGEATLITVAKDVKVQIEFNPRTVGAYRLVGYENRLLNRADFNDDTKDAGEMGAGHTVTALYELIPPGEPVPSPTVDPLVYQHAARPAGSARSDELMTVKLRYKTPESDRSQLVSMAIRDEVKELTPHIGFASAVAQFGMLLRRSEFKGHTTWPAAQALARKYRGEDPDGYRAEFVRLIDLAAALDAQAANSPHTSQGRAPR